MLAKTHCGEHSAHTGDSGFERPITTVGASFSVPAAPSNRRFLSTQKGSFSRADAPGLCTLLLYLQNFLWQTFPHPERCPLPAGKRFSRRLEQSASQYRRAFLKASNRGRSFSTRIVAGTLPSGTVEEHSLKSFALSTSGYFCGKDRRGPTVPGCSLSRFVLFAATPSLQTFVNLSKRLEYSPRHLRERFRCDVVEAGKVRFNEHQYRTICSELVRVSFFLPPAPRLFVTDLFHHSLRVNTEYTPSATGQLFPKATSALNRD